MTAYDDTEDDDLSDISERSNEEDNSDSVDNKNLQTIVLEATHDKEHIPYFKVLKSNVYMSETEPSYNEKQSSLNKALNNTQTLSTTNSDVDKQPEILSATPRFIVPARKLKQSDSEDITSDADSQIEKQSTEVFFSPDESTGDGKENDDRQPIFWSPLVKDEIPESLKQYQQFSNIDENGNEEDSNRSNSNESRKPSVSAEKMALGEPFMHSQLGCIRFCTNTGCVCGVSYFQAILLNVSDIIASCSFYECRFFLSVNIS